MKKKFGNSNAKKYLKSFEGLASLDAIECNLAKRCKFNFSYFISNQKACGKISDWDKETICDFFTKLIGYSDKSLNELQMIGLGKNRHGLLSIYETYPKNSLFEKPKNVPHQARWGRIRLDQNKRLIGFVIPDDYHGKRHEGTGMYYDKNTFYVVFIDNEHGFYVLKK
ncbi:TPA: hypothetical protein M4219_003044 [Klebsiella pneumoniae]|uniref:Uncharacterized protein n=1 Tax=Klebsiella pneumoniae TaxID=573 RepID=A0A9Q6A455_KLEPN|nr:MULTISPECIES: hypothetical protein [Klebsiella]PLE29208.1 hypothetical protein B6I68_03195 [Klebsiella pneumoniae]HCC2943838.1 hypothetical protein [Klebsiella pneumoniae]HDK5992196.1 hypothetical protein [Klebsiella pneumoniae]